jgi:hypothetical protein
MKQEFAAMVAGIPLLPPAEQQELFDAVSAMQASQLAEACRRIVDSVEQAPIDKRVARYVKLRDARAASNKKAEETDRQFKEALAAIEAALIKDAHEQGVTGFKTEFGTTYLDQRMLTSIADENAFFNFVKESGDLDFFERRVKATHVQEWMKNHDGILPPGLNIFREATMKVRRT